MSRKVDPTANGRFIDVSQSIADRLLFCNKTFIGRVPEVLFEPGMNADWSLNSGEPEWPMRFIISRNQFNRLHAKYQLMAGRSIVLARLEYEGPPHTNPDGKLIVCPHLHRYRRNFNDRWAEHIASKFGDPSDLASCLMSFLKYCNIVQCPRIEVVGRLFP